MTEPCNNDSRIRAGTDEPLTPPLDLDGMRHAAAEDEQHGHHLQAGYLRAVVLEEVSRVALEAAERVREDGRG